MIKKVLQGCPICNRYQARPFSQDMAPLPADRVQATRAFSTTGIDFFGPLATTTCAETHGVMFTCAASRAVHLELVRDLKTTTFWRALRRFIARRGLPACIISDNATTFVKSGKDCEKLKKLLNSRDVDHQVHLDIHWDHIAPRAPWWGGFYERMIGSVKQLLKKHLHRSVVTLDELATILTEIEAILNDRPLNYFPEQDLSYTLISPSRLMLGSQLRRLPDLSAVPQEAGRSTTLVTKRAKALEALLNSFWNSWRKDYVASLQRRKGEWGRQHVPEKDEVVLVIDDKKRRSHWQLGRILEVFKGRDGRSRSVKLQTASGELVRAVQSLAPLECSGEDSE